MNNKIIDPLNFHPTMIYIFTLCGTSVFDHAEKIGYKLKVGVDIKILLTILWSFF